MRSLVLVFVLAAFAACEGSDPKSVVVPTDLTQWEANEDLKAAAGRLTDEEKRLFAAYAMRSTLSSAFGGAGMPDGTTLGQAIAIQRQWEAEQAAEEERQAALKQKLEEKRLAYLREMNEALTASLLDIRFRGSDAMAGRYSDQFMIEVGFENLSDQALVGAKGVIVFKDIFGDTIKRVTLSNDATIESGDTAVWSGTMNYNQFMVEDKKLRTTDRDKLKFEWEPVAYIFEDGTRLEMP